MTGFATRLPGILAITSGLDRCGPVLSVVEGSKARLVPRYGDALDTPSTLHATLHVRTNEHTRHIAHHLWLLSTRPSREGRVVALESSKRRQAMLSRIRYDVPDNPETQAHSLLRIAMNYARLAANTLPKEPKSVQKVQEQCRKDFQKCTASQSWTVSRSALDSAESAGFLKNSLSPRKLGNYIPYSDSARRRLAGVRCPLPESSTVPPALSAA